MFLDFVVNIFILFLVDDLFVVIFGCLFLEIYCCMIDVKLKILKIILLNDL